MDLPTVSPSNSESNLTLYLYTLYYSIMELPYAHRFIFLFSAIALCAESCNTYSDGKNEEKVMAN